MATEHKPYAEHAKTVAADAAEEKKRAVELEKHQLEVEKARAEHAKLAAKAAEDRAAAEHGKLTPEQVKANESHQKADDAAAKVAESERSAATFAAREHTIEGANVLGYGKHPDLPASHHLAQKFGNDPANPRPKAGMPEVTDNGMVRLQRTTPDNSTPVYATCHPDLLGDYMRAGWSRDDVEPFNQPAFAAPRETASDGTTNVNDYTGDVREIGDDDPEKRPAGRRTATP